MIRVRFKVRIWVRFKIRIRFRVWARFKVRVLKTGLGLKWYLGYGYSPRVEMVFRVWVQFQGWNGI